jgi:hypothetical protein
VLNLQWIGDIDQIKQLLEANGWEAAPEIDWINILHRISDVQSAEHFPLVSPLYLDKKPVLVLIKRSNSNKKLIALRLWKSDVDIVDAKQPLWVGTVELVPRTYSWLFKQKHYYINLNAELLFKKSPKNYDIQNIQIKSNHRRNEEKWIVLIKPKTAGLS